MVRFALVALTCLALGCRTAEPRVQDIHDVPERYRAIHHPTLRQTSESPYSIYVEDVEPAWAVLPFDSIELRQSPSDGAGGFALRLNRGGTASLGQHTGRVYYNSYAELCFLIERLRVAEMRPQYGFGLGGSHDGYGAYTLKVTAVDGKEMLVEERMSLGPPELHALVAYIESIKDYIRWTAPPPPTPAQEDLRARLVTESWYVHSFAYPVMPLQGYPIEFTEDGGVSTECIGGIDSYLLTDDLELRLGGPEAGTRLFFTFDLEGRVFVSRSLKRPPIVIGPAGFKFTEYTNAFGDGSSTQRR